MNRQGFWDTAALLGAAGFLAWLIPWTLVLSPTMPTGGDTPSQYAAFVHFLEQILPHYRLWGWDPGSLAGYPQGQFYFPLPFLGLSGLSLIFDPAVAFKLGVLLPALGLPFSIYFCLRRLGLEFPGPALGAVLSLTFLLAETNKVWGGNLASILAGEFCYAWAFNLVLIYLGLLPGWINRGRGAAICAVTLFLIGLSHAYGLLFALWAGLFFLFRNSDFRVAAIRLLIVYGVAFCLLGMWIIPMLAYSPHTELFNFVWVIDSWESFLPPTLWPVAVLAGLGAILAWKPGRGRDRERAWYLLFWAASAATLYLLAPFMNAVTIRFGPFGHLALVLLAAQGLTIMNRGLRGKGLLLLTILLAGMVWPGVRMTYLDHWLNWNNAGVERQTLWPSLERLSKHLEGGPSWPRVHYEHSPLNGQAGSVRAFESLPLLTGRSTLEGVYLQASANAPFIFYLQSETSQRGSSPMPGYVYSRFNLERALVHLRLFNVGQFIVVDPATKAKALENKGLFLEREFPPFSLFRVAGNSGSYAQVPKFRPVLVLTPRPQAVAYHWYRFTDCRVPLILAPETPEGLEGRVSAVYRDSGKEDDPLFRLIRSGGLPRKRMEPRRLSEEFGQERIRIKGLKKGLPVLIKVTYHPAWKVESGERIFRVSPSFMMVFPQGEEIVLVFGPTLVHKAGLGLTLIGVLAVLILLAWPGILEGQWTYPALDRGGRKKKILIALALVLWAGGLAWLIRGNDDATTLRNRARSLEEVGRVDQARELYQEGLRRFPMSLVVDYTLYDLAMTYVKAGDYPRAEKYLLKLIQEFPDSVVLPETLYHYGLCLHNGFRPEQAFDYWQRLIMDFPDNHWAGVARQEL